MSHRLDVLAAVRALVAAACPNADVRGFTVDAAKSERIGAGGMIVGDPGDPGDPEYELSPLAYIYTHRIPVEVWLPANTADDSALDGMAQAIGEAIVANRSLSGLCQFLDCTGATLISDDSNGTVPLRIASFDIIAEYAVNNPLGA